MTFFIKFIYNNDSINHINNQKITNGNLFIARHGQTYSNLTGAIVGTSESQLTPSGRLDAYKIGENVSRDLQLIITSPQRRASVSADIVRKYNNASVVEHPFLHPQDFGEIEGMTLDEARNNGFERYLHKKDTNKYLHKGDTGESIQEMEQRTIPKIEY